MKRNTWKRIFLIILCGLLMAAPAFSSGAEGETAAEQNWQLTGQVGGTTKALCREGTTLYVGSGLHVLALDASDPTKLSLLGTSALLPQFVESLVSDGNGTLYACCGEGGLVILDVSNPAEPQILGTLDTRGYTEDMVPDGDYAVLADGPLGVQVVDFSDPANPVLVSSAYSLAYVYAVALQNGIVYAAGGGSGLFTVDLGDPLNPKEAGLLPLDGFQYDVQIANGRLYTAGAWGGVHVLDITDPLSPVKIANAYTPGWAMALAADGNSLLVLDGADGALLCGIAGVQPVQMSALTMGGFMMAGTIDDTSAFVLDEDFGLISLDYTQKSAPQIAYRWTPLLDGRRLTMEDTICYVAGGSTGLHVYDMTDKASPRETYWFDTHGGYANKAIAKDGMLYLSAHLSTNEPLLVFDASDPADLVKLSGEIDAQTTCGTAFRSFAVGTGYAYIAGETADMTVDVRDPENMTVTGYVNLGNPVNGDYSGNLFVSSSNTELQIVDISDPSNPELVGSMKKLATGEAVRFINPTTVLTTDNPGICVVDVSDSANPKKISELAVSGSIMEAFVDGTTAYLSCLGDGVKVVDISDLSHPVYTGAIETLGLAYDCYAKDGLLIVADSLAGMSVYEKAGQITQTAQSGAADAAVPLTLTVGEKPVTYLSPDSSVKPNTFQNVVVTSAEDSGEGTLRACLEQLQEGTIITFDSAVFPAEHPATISLQSPLPMIQTRYVTIDASNAGVILDGSSLSEGNGLQVQASHFTVMGLQIYHFPQTGLEVESDYCKIGGDRSIGTGPVGQGNVSSGNRQNGIRVGGWYGVVSGNMVGVDLSGQKAMPNFDGIFVSDWAFHVTVGGTDPGEANVISGNQFINIDSWGDQVRIIGNLIGVDVTGTKAIRTDTSMNVVMEYGVTNCVLGGTTPEERNIISGAQCGFVFSDPNSYQCSVIGNYIGTDITGTKAIPNGSAGGPWTSSHHRVGGMRSGEGNLVSGNQEGLTMNGYGADENLILGNTIGLDANGAPLKNEIGLGIDMGQTHVVIGGYTAAEGNTIYGGSISLRVSNHGIRAAYLAGNSITSPSGVGLMLSGPTENFVQGNTFGKCGKNAIRIDYGTGNLLRANTFSGNKFDELILLLEGGNDDLAAPVVTAAAGSEVSGTTVPFGFVEVYLSENGSVTSLGSAVAGQDGNFTFTAAEPLTGKQVLALVSDAFGSTSGFSAPVKVN